MMQEWAGLQVFLLHLMGRIPPPMITIHSCGLVPSHLHLHNKLLDPPAGNISVKSYGITLNLALEKSFPQAYYDVEISDGGTGFCRNVKTHTDETGLVTSKCSYTIDLQSRETTFKVLVSQPGFTNKTFQYRVITTVFPSGGHRTMMGGQYWINLIDFILCPSYH